MIVIEKINTHRLTGQINYIVKIIGLNNTFMICESVANLYKEI